MKNKRFILSLILAASLQGCATLQDTVTSTDTFAACRVADIATTYAGVSSGAFTEGNAFTAKLLAHGWMPWIAVSFAAWYVLKWLDKPAVTAVANITTCWPGVHNAAALLAK